MGFFRPKVAVARARIAGVCAALALSVAVPRASFAETGADAADAPTPKRPVPSYDGRPPPRASAGRVALWIPRILLSPVYLVTEYVIRWPLSRAIPAAERADLPTKAYDFFAFGPDHKAGIVPVGFIAFGFEPSVGLYAFWNDVGFAGHGLHLHAEAWPENWYAASLSESFRFDPRRSLDLRVAEVHRPDRVFYGTGPDTLQANQSRYREQTVEASGLYTWRFWRRSRLETGAGVRVADFGPGEYSTDPSVEDSVARGAFALPAGFDRGYTAEYNALRVVVDSREARPFGTISSLPGEHAGSGVYLDAHAEQGSNLRDTSSAWLRYGATVGAYVDLNERGRVLGLAVMTAFADPLGRGEIPFTELAMLGGEGPMRGYYAGRLLGRSTAAATLHYVWPVAPWLGGSLETAVGNAFDPHLSGLRPGRLRFSGSIGLAATELGDYPVEMIVGCGSETFEQGGTIDSFRVTLSVNHGF